MSESPGQPSASSDVGQPGWLDHVDVLDWIRRPRRGMTGATLNACYNALDRHVVHGHGDRTALVVDGSAPGGGVAWSFADLLERSAAFAGALRGLGAGPAERVLLRLPRVREAVVATLACARIGAVATVLAGDPAAEDLGVHLETPAVVVRGPGQPSSDPGDVDWDTAMRAGAGDPAACLDVDAAAPLYVLRDPGGREQVRRTGPHAVALAWSMRHRLGVAAGQVWWSTLPLGSAAGLDHGILGPLLAGATTVLHPGAPDGRDGTTDPDAFWRVVVEHRVDAALTDTATVRALVEAGRTGAGRGQLPLRKVYVAGDQPAPGLHDLASGVLGVPVAELGAPVPGRPGDVPPR